MSDQPTRWEWIQRILDPDGPQGATVRLTLLGLARHMDRSGGSCWPSIPRLMKVTGLGNATIRRAIHDAETGGWLERRPRGRGYFYIPRIPLRASAISDSGNDSDDSETTPGMRSQRAQSEDGNALTGTAIESEPLRSERALSDPNALTASGVMRSERALQRSRTVEGITIPSLRSGGFESLECEVNTPDEDPALLVMAEAASHPPEWKYEHPVNGSEVIGWWIDLRRERPPDGDLKKQGAVAKRLASNHTRGDLLRAMIGISSLFPHKAPRNEPWDLFDLEKKFTKAHDGFGNHPAVEEWRFRAEFQALRNGEQGNHHD